jgi:maltodextrin utilization protein YvdJ
MNKKSVGIIVVALWLKANSVYIVYSVSLAFSLLALAWAILCAIAAYGVFILKRWSMLLVITISVLSLAAWGDGLIQACGKAWPEKDLSQTAISFIPGFFLVLSWVWATLYVIRYFRTAGPLDESEKETNCT